MINAAFWGVSIEKNAKTISFTFIYIDTCFYSNNVIHSLMSFCHFLNTACSVLSVGKLKLLLSDVKLHA